METRGGEVFDDYDGGHGGHRENRRRQQEIFDDEDDDGELIPPVRLGMKDTDLSMLDYYHSDTAGGMASTSRPASAAGADVLQGYETSSSSDDAFSMGPNGYYHPQRSASRSSSPDYSDSHSRRYSSTTVRHGDDSRYRSEVKTPTRSTFQTDSPSTSSNSGRDSPMIMNTTTVHRQPSKRAAANADNRRIAVMQIGPTPMNTSLSDDLAEYLSDSRILARTPPSLDQATRSYSQSEGGRELNSSRRGVNQPHVAFIAPPDAATESYAGLSSPPHSTDKRLQRNSTGTPPPQPRRLQHSRSKSAFEDASVSKRYIPSGPRPLASHLSLSSSSIIPGSTSTFIQHPPQDPLSRSSSLGRGRSNPAPSARQHFSGRSHNVPRTTSSTSISAVGPSLPSKSDLGTPWTAVANPSEITTPDIGQGKEIGAPVAGPTVVPIHPSEMIWTETTAATPSFMGSFASKPESTSPEGYDYDAHKRARTARREEEERGKRRQRSGSQSDSPPHPRSRSKHRDSPPRQGRQRTRPVTPLLSRPPSRSRSPSPASKAVPRVATIPYPSQQSSETSYMFYDPELHGVGPPPAPPPTLRALSSQANIGAKSVLATSVPVVAAPPDPNIHERPSSPPPRPPRRGSPARPPRGAQTDTATAPSAPPQSQYAPAQNYASIHGVYAQSQPLAPASSTYQAATPADFIQQGYYQAAAAAPMIPLYPTAAAQHILVTSAASSPYYASAAPTAAAGSGVGVRHMRERAYAGFGFGYPTVLSTETSAAQQRSSSRHSHRDEKVTLERNTSTTSTNYSYTTTDSRTTTSSAASYDSQRRTNKRNSRPSTPKRWSDDALGQRPGTGDPYTNRSSPGEKDHTTHHPALRHNREGASSTISSPEAPSPPRKDSYPSHQAPSGESNTPHGRSASMDSVFSTSTYASTQSSKSFRLLPPLPGESTSQPQRVDTLDDLVAAVGDAIGDIGLVSVKDVPPPNVLPPSRESKALPPIIPGAPSLEDLDEANLQRANTWSTGQSSSLASAVTDSSVTTSSSAVTGSSAVTSTSAAQSSVTSPGDTRGHEDNYHSKDDMTVGSRASERVYDLDRLQEALQPTLKQHSSTNVSSYTTSSPPPSESDYGESKRSVSGSSHKRQATISGISASFGDKRQSVVKRRASAHSALGIALTSDFNPFEKAPAYQNQSYTRSPEKQRTQTQVVHVQRPAKSTSPLPPPPPERSKRLKQKAVGWPHAMSFGDVLKMRTALDRAAIYAEKINELAATDSGLQAWIFEVKMQKRGLNYRATEHESDVLSPFMSPSSHRHAPGKLRRHRSRGSMATERTFPMRPDAYKATNLRPDGDDGKILPPALPYPGLAARTLATHPAMRSVVSNSSAGKSGFFASIGRKTSIRGKERGIGAFAPNSQGTPTRPAVKLGLASSLTSGSAHSNNTAAPKPRPVQLENAPTLPGGPRAPPHRTSVLMSSIVPDASQSAGPVSPRHAITNKAAIGNPQRISITPAQQLSNTAPNSRTIAAARRI